MAMHLYVSDRSRRLCCFRGLSQDMYALDHHCVSYSDCGPAALNWPDHRGSATAFPLSAFGLSAFFFSTVSNVAFPDNTSDLLLLLALLTVGLCILGTFFLRVVPQSQAYTPLPNPFERSGSDTSTQLHCTKSRESKYSAGHPSQETGTQTEAPDATNDTETSSLLSRSSGSGPGDIPYEEEPANSIIDRDLHHVDIRGWSMLRTLKFWQLWSLLGILTGCGLMTIKYVPERQKHKLAANAISVISATTQEQYGVTTTTAQPPNSSRSAN